MERLDIYSELIGLADSIDDNLSDQQIAAGLRRVADQIRPLDLEAATFPPEPGVQPANSSEFAALWNAKTPERREQMMQLLLDQQSRAHTCFMEDHEGLKARQVLSPTEINVLAQRFYEEASESKEISLVMAMTGKPELVAVLQRALSRIGRFVPPAPESWSTEQTHQDCQHCEAAVEDAIIHAKATGSVEATYTHTTPQPRGDGYSELKHVGTVKRSV